MKRPYSSCSHFNFILDSSLAHNLHSHWQFYLSRFFSRNLAMFFHGFKRKPLWPLCVESGQRASTEYIQTQVEVNSHGDFWSGMAWTTEQGSVYRIELYSALQSVLVPPSWMNKSCFNSPYLISFYLTAMESKTYTLNYMQLPYHLSAPIWCAILVHSRGTTEVDNCVCSGRLHDRFISKRSMQPTSGDISICRLCQVDTIPAPVRLRIGTCWGTRLTAFCC